MKYPGVLFSKEAKGQSEFRPLPKDKLIRVHSLKFRSTQSIPNLKSRPSHQADPDLSGMTAARYLSLAIRRNCFRE